MWVSCFVILKNAGAKPHIPAFLFAAKILLFNEIKKQNIIFFEVFK